jgi:hypothetical protein
MSSLTLSATNNVHQALVRELVSEKDIKKKIKLAQLITDFNVQLHTGRYVSVALEQELVKIGKMISPHGINDQAHKRNTILHVVTELDKVGGHTRLLENVIEKVNDYAHDVILTRQKIADLPQRIIDKKENGILKISCLAYDAVEDKAKALAETAAQYDLVYFHTHQNDIVPLIAHGINKFNKVVFINHADHAFWLGALLITICANIRPYGSSLSATRRGIANNYVLPIPISNSCALNKKQARKELGINENTVLFVCISAYYKLIPDKHHHFFNTVTKILEQDSNFELIVIGISNDDDFQTIGFKQHRQVKLLGIIENPAIYQRAADIYLEGFPHGSLTAILESINLGACPVLLYKPLREHISMQTELAFNGILYHAKDENEYVNNVILLAQSEEKRSILTENIRKNINYFNGGEYWEKVIEQINHDSSKHINFNSDTFKEYNNGLDDIATNESLIDQLNRKYNGNLLQLYFGSKLQRLKLAAKCSIIMNAFPLQLGKFKYLRYIKFSLFVLLYKAD